jgi:predicted porin
MEIYRMKKSLLAIAAMTAFAGAAQAQSSVSIYGVLDYSLVRQSGNGLVGQTFDSAGTATSRMGFMGNEDLGGGKFAKFNLETQLDLGSGGAGATSSGVNAFGSFSRAANLSLGDKTFGEIKMGRQATPAYMNWAGGDAMGVNSMGMVNALSQSTVVGAQNQITGFAAKSVVNVTNAGSTATTGVGSVNQFAQDTQPGINNTGVAYISPTIYGTTLKVFTTASSTTATGAGVGLSGGSNAGQRAASLNYAAGNLAASVSYSQLLDQYSNNFSHYTLANAKYNWNKFTFAAGYALLTYGSQQNGLSTNILSTAGASIGGAGTSYGDGIRIASAGVKYQVTGPISVGLQYTDMKDITNPSISAKAWGLGSFYDFSKRTTIYAMAGTAKDAGGSSYNPVYGGTGLGSTSTAISAAGTSNTVNAYMLGMRHTF